LTPNLREIVMKLTLLLCLPASAGLLLACSGAGSSTGTSANAIVEPGCVEDAGPPPPPPPAHEITVTANGTSCAGREFVGTLSEDEKTLTIRPKPVASRPDAGTDAASAPADRVAALFDNGVDPGQAFSIKDCTFGIDVANVGGRSYAVRAFDVNGYAILDSAGMTAKQSAKYYFMGNPAPARELQTEMAGPFDGAVAFEHTIDASDQRWSPCNTTRRLNAQMRSVVQNNPGKTGAAVVEIDPVFTLELDWRSCPSP
jgi:hypothetical protein